MKLAAIDIGSNAVRLLIMNVSDKEGIFFRKELLVRAPVRLGEQVFLDGELFPNKVAALKKAIQAFCNLAELYDVQQMRACATSAMREARNGPEVVKEILELTGVEIEIIDGFQESLLIFENFANNLSEHTGENFLTIDVGGGSTELVLFAEGEIKESRSFPIGTLRIANELVHESDWQVMKEWIEKITKSYANIKAIGSGGNINKINKIYSNGSNGEPLTLEVLKNIKSHLESFTLVERITVLGLKPDRADVIIPASSIYINAMDWAGCGQIIVPKLGLSDGIIRNLYREIKTKGGDS